MLVATHDIDLARALGGSLAILCNGRIVARGSAAELLEGVATSEEFDHRFRLSDFMGPLRLGDLDSDGDDSERYWSIDYQTIWVGALGLILVAVLVAFTTLGAHLL
jgi:phospholipid/cholesterol/gamma-HCH transport system ATP-binding protein